MSSSLGGAHGFLEQQLSRIVDAAFSTENQIAKSINGR